MRAPASVVMIAGLLLGCAPQPFTATCAMQPVGMTDGGIAVVRMYCEPE